MKSNNDMDIRKITRTDKQGKRLFIEIGKEMKKEGILPALKKGDRILLMPVRQLNEKQMEMLVDRYVKFFDIDYDGSYASCFEGMVRKNNKTYWNGKEEEYDKNKKYVLVHPEFGTIDYFDDLNDTYDLQILKGKEKYVNKVNCKQCKKQFFEAYKYCPDCGRKNRCYQ